MYLVFSLRPLVLPLDRLIGLGVDEVFGSAERPDELSAIEPVWVGIHTLLYRGRIGCVSQIAFHVDV